MNILTVAQAQILLKEANTSELLEALAKSLIIALADHEARPDQSAALAKSETLIESLKSDLALARAAQEEAETIAENAMDQLNDLLEKTPQDIVVTVDKKNYIILFGVDGLTKEELAKDKTKLARLVKIQSGALKLKEDQ